MHRKECSFYYGRLRGMLVAIFEKGLKESLLLPPSRSFSLVNRLLVDGSFMIIVLTLKIILDGKLKTELTQCTKEYLITSQTIFSSISVDLLYHCYHNVFDQNWTLRYVRCLSSCLNDCERKQNISVSKWIIYNVLLKI